MKRRKFYTAWTDKGFSSPLTFKDFLRKKRQYYRRWQNDLDRLFRSSKNPYKNDN